MSIAVVASADPDLVLGQAGDLLAGDPVAHNVVGTKLADAVCYGEAGRYWIGLRAGTPAGVAAAQPADAPLAVAPMPADLVRAVAAAIDADGVGLPGVFGPAETASRFAGLWAAQRTTTATITAEERVYEVRELRFPADVRGTRRRAAAADLELLLSWLPGFESGPAGPAQTRRRSSSRAGWPPGTSGSGMTTARCRWRRGPRPWRGWRGSRPSTPRPSSGAAATRARAWRRCPPASSAGFALRAHRERDQRGRQLGLPAARLPGRQRRPPLPVQLRPGPGPGRPGRRRCDCGPGVPAGVPLGKLTGVSAHYRRAGLVYPECLQSAGRVPDPARRQRAGLQGPGGEGPDERAVAHHPGESA